MTDENKTPEQQEYERRDREYERRRRQEPLMIMSAIVASGIAGREGAATSIANRAVEIALAIMTKVESLP